MLSVQEVDTPDTDVTVSGGSEDYNNHYLITIYIYI